ncbi:hypothetical protein PPERSA_00200 [Pseudocohnilembus persalinus]|uniref:Uncharacterized protein n=1 Tax=Pseudocohnilembus persalinus TaxID=266149 RepID=A0A0V0QQ37_PSEPJ|nr:hypothetical protein PPERSA_00200 [Pseudocohnilembus persalinus]|eukprot:KRX04431.1 hypothetical protein PPERSA_00200 [Pseudocohnilembus persalinus]
MEGEFYQESEMVKTEQSESPMMSEEETRNMINNYQQTISCLGQQIQEIEVKRNNLKERNDIMKSKVGSNKMTVEKQQEMELFFKEEIPSLQKEVSKLLKKLQVQNQIHSVDDIEKIQNMDSSIENRKNQNKNKRLSLPLKIEQNIQHIQQLNQNIVDKQDQEFKKTQDVLEEVKEEMQDIDINQEQQEQQSEKVENIDNELKQTVQENSQQKLEKQVKKQSINSLGMIKADTEQIISEKELEKDKLKYEKQIGMVQENFQDIFDENEKQFLQKLKEKMSGIVVENRKMEIEKQLKINEAILINEEQKEDEKDNMVLKTCVNCRNIYSPLCNTEESCQYHSGQLRFYSCLKCGADEYYNCCNSCIKCSSGCMLRKHACTLG